MAESDTIELDDLPPTVRGDCAGALVPSLARDETMRACGSRYAHLMLERCRGNKREACRVLGISYHTLAAYLSYELPEVLAGEAEPGEQCVAEA
jgi:DNA-binding NtrC family response regulator